MEAQLPTADTTFKPIFDGDPVQSPNILYQNGLIVSAQLNRNRDLLEGGLTTVSPEWQNTRNWLQSRLTKPENKNCSPDLSANT
jgi:hypothetical protein